MTAMQRVLLLRQHSGTIIPGFTGSSLSCDSPLRPASARFGMPLRL